MNNKIEQQKEFIKLYLMGQYTQRALAKRLGVSGQTASRWVRDIQPLKYFTIRKQLTIELERLIKQRDYEKNGELITRLIADVESIEKLIIKAKYIPHLTQQ